jgi:palmitoyl-protein thioesterase
MGDSCFNDGMISIVHLVAQWTGRYTVCIPMGSNQQEDTSAGYFLNMEASVDKFAAIVQLDSNMKQGFHAIGLSQGNNIIRGYIAKYNNPPVHTFISINGVNAGVGAVPYCLRKDSITEESFYIKESLICRALMEVASEKAYTTFAQQHSFQANYWRDPRQEYWDKYLEYSQLAYYNNERPIKNYTLNDNFGKTKKFVWIMAEQDEMVWPKEVCFTVI